MSDPPKVVATTTQYEALQALALHGSMKVAAHRLSITDTALRHRLANLRGRSRMTTVQLVYALGTGRVVVQDGFWLWT